MEQSNLQQQKQILSASQQQSLHLLELPVQELRDFLQEVVTDNPLLELPQDAAGESLEQLAAAEHGSMPLLRYGDGSTPEPAEQGEASERETLREHLLAQLNADKTLPAEFRPLCAYLIESLNPRGYLEDTVEELAAAAGVTPYSVQQALYAVQQYTPAGVGARSVEECLLLQLSCRSDFCAGAVGLIRRCLPELAADNLAAAAKKLKLPLAETQRCAAIVRSLNPLPGSGFYVPAPPVYLMPDVIFEEKNGALTVRCTGTGLALRILPDEALLGGSPADEKTAAYLQAKRGEALRLQQDLQRRSDTLQRAAAHAASVQYAYLTGRSPAPQTLTIAQTAQALDLSPATVSRAVKDKYYLHAGRLYPLRGLFRAAAKGPDSRDALLLRLRRLVEAEDPAAPLSDEAIAAQLCAAGFTVSRRTAAQYREQLGIPCSGLRKKR